MRKAQIQGQIIVYILAAVIVTLILFYGYSAIADLNKKSETVSLIKFQKDLSAQIRSMSSEYGSESVETLIVPSGYEQICFVDERRCLELPCNIPSGYPLVADSVNSKVNKTVFLRHKGVMEESFYIEHMSVENTSHAWFCVDVSNQRTTIHLEGQGDNTLVTPN